MGWEAGRWEKNDLRRNFEHARHDYHHAQYGVYNMKSTVERRYQYSQIAPNDMWDRRRSFRVTQIAEDCIREKKKGMIR